MSVIYKKLYYIFIRIIYYTYIKKKVNKNKHFSVQNWKDHITDHSREVKLN